MAIARRTQSSDLHTAGVTAMSVTLPTTPVDQDVLVALVLALTTADPTSVPAGWSLLGSQQGGANSKSWLYTKVAAGESGPYAWTLGSQVKCGAWIGCYSGADTTTAPTFLSSNPASGQALAVPGLSIPDQGWAITSACCRHSAIATPSSWTTSDTSDSELVDFGSGTSGSDIAMGLYDSNRALTAQTIARTLTSTNTEGQIAMWSVALAPASSGGGGGGTTPTTPLPARVGVNQ